MTNGVHIPTWIGGPMRELLDRHLGEGWLDHAADPETWAGVDTISDEELWAVRSRQRAEFVEYVRGKSVLDRLGRDEPRSYVEAAAGAFDPDALTIGFARRLATYKRLHLLVQDADRALALLSNGRPVQLVLAGKAHPRDDGGKRMVQHLFSFKWAPEIGGRVVYLDDYDLSSAARMVRGCDVWLNLPRPPLEASGTSGMKSAVNGGPAAQRARRLVGGGLRRRERLGAAGRGGPRPRRAGPARRDRAAPAARTRRSRASSTTATSRGSRAHGSPACAGRSRRTARRSRRRA